MMNLTAPDDIARFVKVARDSGSEICWYRVTIPMDEKTLRSFAEWAESEWLDGTASSAREYLP